jgi:hypothetical protein
MKFAMYVLRRPYSVVAGVILLCILGVGAALAHARRYFSGTE